jgi:hypothetical protein
MTRCPSETMAETIQMFLPSFTEISSAENTVQMRLGNKEHCMIAYISLLFYDLHT